MRILVFSLLSSGLSLASLEEEYSEDTSRCVETARSKHLDNPNAGLDHFVNCLLAQLQQIPDDTEDSELKEVKTSLKDFEKLDSADIVHNLVRRDTEDQVTEDEEEARGWKKDKKEKKNKKKLKKKLKLEELLGKLDDSQEETEEKEEETEKEEDVDVETEPASNVVQFSVYSAQPRPQYSPPPQAEKKKYLFSVDYQGNAHYINEDEVSALLRTPQAMKAMISYLGSDQGEKAEGSAGYRVPETRLYRPRPAHTSLAPARGPPPRLEYFGPKDFVPESAFLIPQSKIWLNGKERPGSPGPAREKLEPKPRKLFKRSPDDSLQERMGVIHLFRKKPKAQTKVALPAPAIKQVKTAAKKPNPRRNRRKKERKAASLERCKKCSNPKIAKKSVAMCKKCQKSSDRTKTVSCGKCKNERYRTTHPDCSKLCKSKQTTTVSTTTTITTTTTTATTSTTQTSRTRLDSPVRSLVQQRKECRNKVYRRNNKEECKKVLDKCNSRMFRTTHQQECSLRKGDSEWVTQKCQMKVFANKNTKLCNKSLKKPDPTGDSFESLDLETLVQKCKEESYKEENEEQCKVVEDLDDSIENIKAENQPEDEGETNSPSEPEQDSVLDDPSRQKADIVEAIERQTNKKNGEKKKKKNKKNKKKKKKDEEGNKEKTTKEKSKMNKKSKCNKPKYSSTHPEECKSSRLEDIFVEKCKKEKYRAKHQARCKVVTEGGDTNIVLDTLMDVRCRKESFRTSFPSLCSQDEVEAKDAETTTISPGWLKERCKHSKFQERNVELCSGSNVREYELDIEHPEDIIDNVINDIKNIVSNEAIPPLADNPLQDLPTKSTDEVVTMTPEPILTPTVQTETSESK